MLNSVKRTKVKNTTLSNIEIVTANVSQYSLGIREQREEIEFLAPGSLYEATQGWDTELCVGISGAGRVLVGVVNKI